MSDERQRDLQAGEDLRQRRRQRDLPHQSPLARAHVARRPDELALDALDAGDRRGHHRKDRVEHHHRDLRHVVEAEPQDDDRQERDLRHRKADRDDRIEEPAHRRAARHREAERMTPPTGRDQEADQRAVEREADVDAADRRAIASSQMRASTALERRQHERRHRVRCAPTAPSQTRAPGSAARGAAAAPSARKCGCSLVAPLQHPSHQHQIERGRRRSRATPPSARPRTSPRRRRSSPRKPIR